MTRNEPVAIGEGLGALRHANLIKKKKLAVKYFLGRILDRSKKSAFGADA